ncbi:MAG: type II secretion system protein [Verrucomicrobia bacterium]|nr:type II secretion system protein [Verrucomicrobiota bacterium]
MIEIMLVVAILAIVMTMGMPAIYRSLKLEPLRQGASDVVEACSNARARAILQGGTMEVVIRAEDGQINVQPASGVAVAVTNSSAASSAAFSARLGKDIGIAMLDVNLMDQMQASEARVRFFPNGTCDEFTLVLQSEKGEIRKITLEATTGLADVEALR